MTNKNFRNKYKAMVPASVNIETVGDGWHNLIITALDCVRLHTQRNKNLRPTITELKEKFGLLRLSMSINDSFINGVTTMASAISAVICEGCGQVGTLKKQGYHRVTCKKCEKEYLEGLRKR